MYLDNLSFSQKFSADRPQSAAPASYDDAQDVIAVTSDQFTAQVADYDPLYQWSTLTAAGGGGEPSGSAHRYAMIDGKNVDVYEQVGFFAGMFAPDQWGTYPAATSMDVSASDTLKMTMWRTDPLHRFRLTFSQMGRGRDGQP